MRIAGFLPNSFVDYPGKIAMVVFTAGCNLNCWYCHNRHLIRASDVDVYYSPSAILADLKKKKGFLDAVVISGGEPTLQKGLKQFAASVKELGYLVKLDTNGTNPDIVREMIAEGLVDYVAMDIKAPFDKYDKVVCKVVDIDAIKQTAALLIGSSAAGGTRGGSAQNSDAAFDYEFRTTFAPDLTCEDIAEIAHQIRGAKRFTLQQYRPVSVYCPRAPHPPDYVKKCAENIEKLFLDFRVLGV